jgi:hypothetical protein
MEASKHLTLLSSVYQEFGAFHVESWIGGVDGSFILLGSGLCHAVPGDLKPLLVVRR